jgi:hypothetical protein
MTNELDGVINHDKANEVGKKWRDRFKESFKNFINSIRIPRLVDVLVKNPNDLQSALKDAPEASKNWVRLGLEQTWPFFAIVIIVIALYLLQVAAKFIAVIGLLLFGWYLISKILKK